MSEWGNPLYNIEMLGYISALSFLCCTVFNSEYIGVKSEPRELKHLSTWRKGNQPRLRK
jgi:hypothetical protein